MGSMDLGLPAVIGASFAKKYSPIVMIVGDGGFQSNIQELQTIVHHKLPIKIIIRNNNCHGRVRQFQEDYFDVRYQSTLWGYSAPNFESVGMAYCLSSRTITKSTEVNEALQWMWKDHDELILLQVMIDAFWIGVFPGLTQEMLQYVVKEFKNFINTFE
jgi:acetolactate synthase I/II/III large subunit